MARSKLAFVWLGWTNEHRTATCHTKGAVTMMKDVLRRTKLDQCSIKNFAILKDPLMRGDKPKKSILVARLDRLKAKLQEFKPDIVVVFGAQVFDLFAQGKKISDWAGRLIDAPALQCKIVGIVNPDIVEAYPVKRRDFVVQMDSLASAVHGGKTKTASTSYRVIKDARELRRALRKMSSPVSFDYETTGLDPFADGFRVRSVAFCDRPGHAVVVPLEECKEDTAKVVRDWLESDVEKIAHNAKYEIRVSRVAFGVTPMNIRWDTMILHHLIAEDMNHGLDALAFEYTELGGYDSALLELFDKGLTYATVPMADLIPYNAGDVDVTRRVLDTLRTKIDAEPNAKKLWEFYNTIAQPNFYVLASVEDNGMHIDVARLKTLREELRVNVREISEKIDRHIAAKKTKSLLKVKGKFNPKSAAQVSCLLFRVLKLPVPSRTKSGAPSTQDIDQIANEHPLVKQIIQAREYLYDISVLNGLETYIRADQCCNSNYYAAGTVTWRYSSANPPLQNMPRNGRVKTIFTSRFQGGKIMQGDYSQLEIRILGILSGEKKFRIAFKKGYDFHTFTAAKTNNILQTEVTDEQRTQGKRTNFGVIFGIGNKKLARELRISTMRAEELIAGFFEAYPAVERWFSKGRRLATTKMRVENPFGAARRVPHARHEDQLVRWRAQRQACNFLIQSTGGALTLIAMNYVHREFKRRRMRSVLIGQVHDSLIIDAHPAEFNLVAEILHGCMTDRTMANYEWISIPLVVDVGIGPNLGETEKVKRGSWIGPRRKSTA